MVHRRFPIWLKLARTSARGLSWLTALGTLLILGFMARHWPKSGVWLIPGLLIAAAELLTDSWAFITGEKPDPDENIALLVDNFSIPFLLWCILVILFRPNLLPDDKIVSPYLDRNSWFTLANSFKVATWTLGWNLFLRIFSLILFKREYKIARARGLTRDDCAV